MARPTPPDREPADPPSQTAPTRSPSAAALVEYEARKAEDARHRRRPDAAGSLVRGPRPLKDEARTHREAVTRLNPKNETAWKHLGCRKRNNRWMTAAMIAAERRARAGREALEEARGGPPAAATACQGAGGPDERDEAEAELATLDDPTGVAHVFWADLRRGCHAPQDAGRSPPEVRDARELAEDARRRPGRLQPGREGSSTPPSTRLRGARSGPVRRAVDRGAGPPALKHKIYHCSPSRARGRPGLARRSRTSGSPASSSTWSRTDQAAWGCQCLRRLLYQPRRVEPDLDPRG